MPLIHGNGGNAADVDANGTLATGLFDANGNAIAKTKGGAYVSTHGLLPLAGVNDGVYRPARLDRSGALATAKYTPMVEYPLFSAALPPAWLAPVTTMTVTHSVTSGTLLNGSAIGTANSNAALISFGTIPRFQRSPMFQRTRARLVKGATNGVAEIGTINTNAPGSAINNGGCFFQYATDGSLKPVITFNGAVVATGTDFAASIDSTRYYTWDIYADDNSATFVVQDATTGAVVTEQTLNIGSDANRLGGMVWLYGYARCYVGAAANVGAATQLYIADMSMGLLDTDAGKDWAHVMAALGKGSVVNPTAALTQLENYANSAAPVSATLSNTAAGYTTLGGQFQFAAPAGAETDFALFAFTVPTGVRLHVTDIDIETFNMGAAVATTPHLLQWFAGVDGTAVTLATNNFRKSLGVQSLAIATAIGGPADKQINRHFESPLVTNAGRIFHIGLKIPVGTATAAQIIRGLVSVAGYFE
jgi:hypothetical protein